MNRTVWIARFVALIMLLLFALLFANLHRKLTHLNKQQASPARANE